MTYPHNTMRFGRVLIVTADELTRARLLHYTTSIGIEVNMAFTPTGAGRYYYSAPLVLTGVDQAAACLRAGLPTWGDIIIVAFDNQPTPRLEITPPLENVRVVTLPSDQSWLGHRLREELPIEHPDQ